MLDEELGDRATKLLDLCKGKNLTVATAESCTGGLLAAALTNIAGSSAVIDRGFVTYTNEAKQQMLGVPPITIERHGAVSRETAEAMAAGVLAHAQVDLAVSVTGIAGPTGATAGKPIGLVYFGAAARNGRAIHRERRFGDIGRTEVRRKSVLEAIAMLTELAEQENAKPARGAAQARP
jgi:nicotinamide-nucleotide amidase